MSDRQRQLLVTPPEIKQNGELFCFVIVFSSSFISHRVDHHVPSYWLIFTCYFAWVRECEK